MTTLHQALQAFWSGFGIPAYVHGYAPKDAAMPYITYEMAQGRPGTALLMTAFVWVKRTSGQDAEATREAYLDAISAALHPGKALGFTGGYADLYPAETNFLSVYDDPNDPTVLGGRVALEVRFNCL